MAALISVSVAPSKTPAYIARPQINFCQYQITLLGISDTSVDNLPKVVILLCTDLDAGIKLMTS